MSVRPKWIVAAPIAVALAAACVTAVEQDASSGTFLRATFDSTRGVIPTPNDLALQASFRQPAGATRSGLFTLVGLGGFFADRAAAPPLSATSVIAVPFEQVVDGVASPAAGAAIDPATVNSHTVAIFRVSVAPAVQYDPIPIPTTSPVLLALPGTEVGTGAGTPGVYVAGGRYVVAVRGGPSGVKTSDGRTLAASSPIFLVATGVDLSNPDARPATLTAQEVADLQRLQGLLANAVDWTEFLSSTTCAAINAPAPSSAFVDVAAPGGACWVPLVPGVPGAPGSPPSASALAAVGLAFPVTEAVSIQTFEIQ